MNNEEINKTKKETKKMKDLRPQAPRTVPLKDVLYVVAILTMGIVAIVTGWQLRGAQQDQIRSEANNMVSSLNQPSKTKQ